MLGTRYGARVLEALRSVVADHKARDPMAPVTVVVPNNVAGIVARRHLAQGFGPDQPGIAGIHLSTLPRLAEQLAAPALAPRRPATPPLLASAWRSAMDQGAGSFDPVKDHPATVRALVRADRELRDLSDTALDAVAGSGPLAAALMHLHRQVRDITAAACYDVTDLLRTAVDRVSADPTRASALGAVVLYLPQDLTRAESAFARALVDHGEVTVLAGLTGVRRADTAVRRSLDRLGTSQPEAPFAPTAGWVLHASDSDEEVRCVVREVSTVLREVPADRVAVLYADPVPYARLLHEHLATAGITVNGPGPRAVHERAIAQGLLGILSMPEQEMARVDLFRALARAPVRAFDGTLAPVTQWERVSRAAGVVRADDWTQRLDAYIDTQQRALTAERGKDDPYQPRVDAAQRQIEVASGLRRFAGTLSDRLAQGASLTTWPGLSRWALDLFHDLYGDPEALTRLPPEEQYAAAAVEQTLRGLAGLSEFEPVSSLSKLREVLGLELEAAIPRVGRFGEGVFVAPVSAAVGLDANTVFVCGLAEDAYPGRLSEDALLPERARTAAGGELTLTRERLDAKHRHLLAAFQAAPRVVASFPRGDLRRSTQRLPSRWLLPTLRDIAGRHDLPLTEWSSVTSDRLTGSASHAAEIRRTDRLATEQEWRVRAISAGHRLDDGVLDAGVHLVRARAGADFTRFGGNLTGVGGLPDYAAGHRPVSPTALESYADCPFAYFVERLLRVRPLEQPEETLTISALDIGTLIHESIDALVTEFADALPSYGEPWTATQRRRLQEIAAEKADALEQRGVTGHPVLWERERRRILLDLDAMLTDDDTWRADRDARAVASELTFGKDGRQPVALPVPQGEVLMVGSADKVDVTRSGTLLVTDIKTGSRRSFLPIEKGDDPMVGGTKLQLPVYAVAALDYAAAEHLDVHGVEAQYWFVRKDRGKRVKVELSDDLSQAYADTIGTLVAGIADGLFPAKPPKDDDFGWVRCWYCNPDGLGYTAARERWLRKRHAAALADLVALIDPLPQEPT